MNSIKCHSGSILFVILIQTILYSLLFLLFLSILDQEPTTSLLTLFTCMLGAVSAYWWQKKSRQIEQTPNLLLRMNALLWATLFSIQAGAIFMSYTDESPFQFVCIITLFIVAVYNYYKQYNRATIAQYRTALTRFYNLYQLSKKSPSVSGKDFITALQEITQLLNRMRNPSSNQLKKELIELKFSLMEMQHCEELVNTRVESEQIKHLANKINGYLWLGDEAILNEESKDITPLANTLVNYLQNYYQPVDSPLEWEENVVEENLLHAKLDLEKRECIKEYKRLEKRPCCLVLLLIALFFLVGTTTILLLEKAYLPQIYHILIPTAATLIVLLAYFKIESKTA